MSCKPSGRPAAKATGKRSKSKPAGSMKYGEILNFFRKYHKLRRDSLIREVSVGECDGKKWIELRDQDSFFGNYITLTFDEDDNLEWRKVYVTN